MAKSTQRAFRLPEDVISVLSQKENATEYVIQALREQIRKDRENAVYESLNCLAYDDEANDISAFQEAQAEVFRRID